MNNRRNRTSQQQRDAVEVARGVGRSRYKFDEEALAEGLKSVGDRGERIQAQQEAVYQEGEGAREVAEVIRAAVASPPRRDVIVGAASLPERNHNGLELLVRGTGAAGFYFQGDLTRQRV